MQENQSLKQEFTQSAGRSTLGLTAKRVFDLSASTAALIVLSLPIAFAMAAMAIDTRSSPLFKDKRVGKHGKPFTIYKIKTMRDAFNKAGKCLPDGERTSKIGALVRKSRIDELPQLFNIIKGDMSLVGPRPFRASDAKVSGDLTRQTVTPGLTGYAQINGNNKLTLEQTLEYDLSYIQKTGKGGVLYNMALDLAIIAATPLALLIHHKAPHYRPPSLPGPDSK